jgi:uncharacterized protein
MRANELMNHKNWVVVGDVINSSKYAYKILHRLRDNEYNVSGVNPRAKDGDVYKSLAEVPYGIEVIDLCINPALGIEIAKEAKEIGIKYILIQPGAESEEILSFCVNNDIIAIEGCALVELSKMFGGTH